MDPFLNFALGTLAAAINSVQTSAVLASGDDAYFPPTRVSGWNAILWDEGTYAHPGAAYRAGKAEIVRVTVRSGVNLPITRAQEGTTAQDFSGLTVGIYAPTGKPD